MAIQTTAQNVQAAVGGYDINVNSLYDLDLPPQVFQQIYEQYGPRSYGMFDFLAMVGNEVDITNDELILFELPALRRSIKIGSEISTGAAGVDITFTLAADQYNTNNAGPLRIGDSIYIPPRYVEINGASVRLDAEYQVTATSGSGTSTTYTAKPFRIGSTTGFEIAVAIPANTVLRKGANKHGRGTDQPEPMNTGILQRSYQTAIIKETLRIEGGQQAQRRYTDFLKMENANLRGGGQGLYSKALAETEFRWKDQMNDAIFLGYLNNNSTLTQNNRRQESRSVKSTLGLRNWIDDRGQLQTYNNRYNYTDFDQIKRILITQGFGEGSVDFLMGDQLLLDVENSTLDHVKEYSGGTDFTSGLESYGVRFRAIEKNGINFMLKELPMFSEQQTYGSNSDYGYRSQGMIIPRVQTMMYKDSSLNGGKTFPNVFVGYLNNNGENRRFVFKDIAGMNGFGLDAKHTYDEMEWGILSEWSLIVAKANQFIWVEKA